MQHNSTQPTRKNMMPYAQGETKKLAFSLLWVLVIPAGTPEGTVCKVLSTVYGHLVPTNRTTGWHAHFRSVLTEKCPGNSEDCDLQPQ